MRKFVAILLFAVFSTAGGSTQALKTITAPDLLRHIKTLASDKFEGRAPGTKGEEFTVDYLAAQFRQFGLQPGNPDGTYFQKVPLVGIVSKPEATFFSGEKKLRMNFPDDYFLGPGRPEKQIKIDRSQLVFAGFGVVAPEYGWDDYANLDVRGKTVLIFSGDPHVPDPKDPKKLDDKMFQGKAVTYYGTSSYKKEIAAEKGAVGIILIHDPEFSLYPYEAVKRSVGREDFDIAGGAKKAITISGIISQSAAKRLFSSAGDDLSKRKPQALKKGFSGFPLNAYASFNLSNTLRNINSRNVIAKVEGSERKDEYVIYTAHWDHLGRDPKLKGDQIYNGAFDNASGTAGVLEVAEAFSRLEERPKRTVLFLAVTAEEKGLLGSKWYAEHPLYPIEKTVANINIDGVNVHGRTKDLALTGYGYSTLEDVLAAAAKAQGRSVKPEPNPAQGYFFRSDHFEFVKRGVPAIFLMMPREFVGKAPDFGEKLELGYLKKNYHKVSDEVQNDWDLSGAVEDLQLLFETGYRVAQSDDKPRWKEGAEFQSITK